MLGALLDTLGLVDLSITSCLEPIGLQNSFLPAGGPRMRGTPVGLGSFCLQGRELQDYWVVWCGVVGVGSDYRIGWDGGTSLMTSTYKRAAPGCGIGIGTLDLQVVHVHTCNVL